VEPIQLQFSELVQSQLPEVVAVVEKVKNLEKPEDQAVVELEHVVQAELEILLLYHLFKVMLVVLQDLIRIMQEVAVVAQVL